MNGIEFRENYSGASLVHEICLFFSKKRKTAKRQTPYYRHRLFCRNRTLSICHLIVWRVAVTAAAVVIVVVHLFSMCSYIYFPIETLATHIECVYVCLCVCGARA